MGLISLLLGLGSAAGSIGNAASDVAEVVAGNQAKRDDAEHKEHLAALDQLSKEFASSQGGWFDQVVDGLNRLPRPLLALGTMGLFIYAMTDPLGFAQRMRGLQLVPDPLWWLLGAIVSFYFGARELHHFRHKMGKLKPENIKAVLKDIEALEQVQKPKATQPRPGRDPGPLPQPLAKSDPDYNPVVEDWRQSQM
jgi:hypothetical protein